MTRAACLAVALALPCGAWAAGEPTPALPRISFERFSLPNGLRVILSRDNSVPVVAVAFIVDVGGRQETRGRSGFAHLFEHMMFEGSAHAPKGAFDRVLETYGGDNNASTHEDFTFYYEVVPSNALPIALWLDADRLGALSVTEEAVKNQIEVVKEEKRMSVDNEPYQPLLYVEMASHTFSNWHNAHPTIGTFEDLDAARLKDVKSFFEAYYAPRNVILAVVGDIDTEEARRWVTAYFSGLPNKGKAPEVDTAEPEPAGERRVALSDPHAKLPALAVAWKGMPGRGSPDFYALAILERALFSGKSSRLYQGMVKGTQAAVSVEGGLGFPLSDAAEYKAPGAFGCFVVHKANWTAKRIFQLVSEPIADIAARGLPAQELARLKTKFRSDWMVTSAGGRSGMETALARASKLLTAALLDGDPEAANTLDRYMSVTSEDVARVAAKYFRSEAATVFEVSPAPAESPAGGSRP